MEAGLGAPFLHGISMAAYIEVCGCTQRYNEEGKIRWWRILQTDGTNLARKQPVAVEA